MATKHDYSKDDIRSMVKDEDVKFLRLMFTDLFGTIKNVEVPITQLDKLLDNKLMFDGSSIEGFVRIEESDMYLYPDLSTWMIFPWSTDRGKIARVICQVYRPNGEPYAADPRNNLIRVLGDMKKARNTLKARWPVNTTAIFMNRCRSDFQRIISLIRIREQLTIRGKTAASKFMTIGQKSSQIRK